VIHGAPKTVRLAVDPDENLIQVPTPLRERPMMDTSFPDRGREHRSEAVPPGTYCLVADIDAAFVEKILDLS